MSPRRWRFWPPLILISVIFRLTFGRRLRLPRNGRTRLPRLGTVDAFDLDRQRQLVIIRRDNVEHLLMIGGPNDLLIESQIIRAESREPRDFREARLRDKDLRDKEPRDAPSAALGLLRPKSPPPFRRSAKCRFRPPLLPRWSQRTQRRAGVLTRNPPPGRLASTVSPAPRPPAFPPPPDVFVVRPVVRPKDRNSPRSLFLDAQIPAKTRARH